MNITIHGRPISKKNSKQIIPKRGTGGFFILPSKAWKTFEKDALQQLQAYERPFFSVPVRVNYKFSFKGNMSTDVDNAMGGINDILQMAGILADDKFVRRGDFDVITGCEDWKTELIITPI